MDCVRREVDERQPVEEAIDPDGIEDWPRRGKLRW